MLNIDLLPDGSSFDFWEQEVSYERELFVDCNDVGASDSNDGSSAHPFKTIQRAAEIATPGTHVWIRKGEYRECVQPLMGGESASKMICYEAVEKGKVIIKASEIVRDFEPTTDWQLSPGFGTKNAPGVKAWCHRLDPEMFKGYNPFCAVNIIHDRLFIEFDKTDMTPYLNRRGMVFVDGKPLKQVPLSNDLGKETGTYWVEANGMAVHFRLENDDDPKNHLIEISCREQCFVPKVPFLSFVKIKGIVCAHATMGAPIPQRGAISANRGNHFVIEDCTVDWANATGIDVGNEDWHHNFETEKPIGYSVIRRCNILDAGVCGIAGLYAQGVLVEDCLIEGTGWQHMELSWEAAGMKLHNSVNGLFRRNIFKRTYWADHIWLDCGNINNRIVKNLFLDGIKQREAIFIECTRDGINLIDNNIFWNVEGRFDPEKIPNEPGSSGWYKLAENDVINGYAIYGEGTDRMHIENNFIGKCRSTGYFAKPVPFRVSPFDRGGTSRDASFSGNIFYECGEAAMKLPTKDNKSDKNLFVKMSGGFLRILYPAPQVNLDLHSWQEFYGLDIESQLGWWDFKVDTENYTVELAAAGEKPFRFGPNKDFEMMKDKPEDVKTVGGVYPGPFEKLEIGRVYNIDPRKF